MVLRSESTARWDQPAQAYGRAVACIACGNEGVVQASPEPLSILVGQRTRMLPNLSLCDRCFEQSRSLGAPLPGVGLCAGGLHYGTVGLECKFHVGSTFSGDLVRIAPGHREPPVAPAA